MRDESGFNLRRGDVGVDPLLVGRATEVGLFDLALDHVAAGGGSVLLITGEGGAGKIVLIERYLAQALEANFRSAWATVPDAEGAPPFWP
jgi:hypothetical protein